MARVKLLHSTDDGSLKVRISADTDGPGKIELFDKDSHAISK